MEQLKFLRYQNVFAVVFILFSTWIRRISAMQVCHKGLETTNLTKLTMNLSKISGSTSNCSCSIQLQNDARIQMVPYITIPGCKTKVSLSDVLFTFSCMNGMMDNSIPYIRKKNAGDVLLLLVSSIDVSQPMSGYLQIKTTPTSSQFAIECFDANTSETTPNPATPTRETTTPSSTTPVMVASTIPSVTEPSLKEFPVEAVAGGIAGGLLLILIVTLAVVCLRRRNREQQLLENGGQPSTDQGYGNRAFDSGVPPVRDMKPQDTQSSDNTNHVHVENELYASADSDHQPHHSQVNLTDSVPGHNASPGDPNIDKSEVESVEGSEIVITSSRDLYAVVDESKKNQHVTDTNPTASLADLYAVVDPTKKHQDELLFDPIPTQDDEYAVVNKKQDPHDIDPTSVVSPSGDVYAVVNKKQDPQDIDPTSVLSPSGDVYAVVNKKQDPQEFDTTHTFSPFEDVDKKHDSQVLDANHVTSSSGDVYAVVAKKQKADQNDHMARSATDDEEEEAIRRVMDMNDERPSSDTLQSTSL